MDRRGNFCGPVILWGFSVLSVYWGGQLAERSERAKRGLVNNAIISGDPFEDRGLRLSAQSSWRLGVLKNKMGLLLLSCSTTWSLAT